MTYQIIKDSELSVDTLIGSKQPLFTESEIKLYKKTPWTWHLISQSPFEKNRSFYIDAGYTAFATVATLDNTLMNALKEKTLSNLSKDDLGIDTKLIELNKLSSALNLNSHPLEMNEYNMSGTLFDCKMQGLLIAQICQSELIFEQILFHASASKTKQKEFQELIKYVSEISPVLAFVKGSYLKYIESDKTSRMPSDIDVPMIVRTLTESNYYRLIQKQSSIDNIEIRPMIIPMSYMDGYTFFDLGINPASTTIYGHANIFLRSSSEEIIRVIGNSGLEKIRSFLVDDEKIEKLCEEKHAHRKIYSAIRQPDIFYERLKDNNLHKFVNEPFPRYLKFNKELPLPEIKQLLAESSIELSAMTQSLNTYIENKQNETYNK